MRIVHLMASPFYGGPERQMLGLARHLSARFESSFLTFAEGGRCQPFLDQVKRFGLEGQALHHNAPHFGRAIAEVAEHLRTTRADVLCTSGYKPDILGWRAARKAGIPAVSISHGWTAATWKVRLNEAVDRWVIRRMDAVVCVSAAQGDKVRRAGVAEQRIAVIPNAVGPEAFAAAEPSYLEKLRDMFPDKPRWIVGAAGRLSPEKGFVHLVDAARLAVAQRPDLGFVIFGDGPERALLTQRIAQYGIEKRVVLAGFRDDVAKFLPHLDLVVLPSLTEGLPVILLEAFAAGTAVVATSVGGIPEVIEEGRSGRLVASGDAAALSNAIAGMFHDGVDRSAMGRAGQERVRREFSFDVQCRRYEELFDGLVGPNVHEAELASSASGPSPEARCR